MAAVAHFSEACSKYVVTFPDGTTRKYIRLDDAAADCDRIGCELHYKGTAA